MRVYCVSGSIVWGNPRLTNPKIAFIAEPCIFYCHEDLFLDFTQVRFLCVELIVSIPRTRTNKSRTEVVIPQGNNLRSRSPDDKDFDFPHAQYS